MPVLWLGRDCSVSMGCFTVESLNMRLSQMLGIEITTNTELQKQFAEHGHKLSLDSSGLRTNRLAFSLLAQLIARGYFRVIVNSNTDFMLEDELRILLPSNQLVIASRRNHSEQEIVKMLAGLRPNCVLVLRIGERDRQRRSSSDLDKCLRDELGRLIVRHRLIFIGFSLAELLLPQVVSDVKKCWFVDPFTTPSDFQKGFETDLDQFITGEDALFDNFLQGICFTLLNETVSHRLMMGLRGSFSKQRARIDKIVDRINFRLRAEYLDDVVVEELTRKLLEQIQSFAAQRSNKICLLFANDAESPGGREIKTLIDRIPHLKMLVSQYPSLTVNITGRAEIYGGRRAVTSIEPPFDPNRFDAFVILDDISFSGNTLHILRDYLIRNFGLDRNRIVAALLQIDPDAKSNLEADGWHVIFGSEHVGFGFSCPWGYARPTRAKLSNEEGRSMVDLKAKLGATCFMPHSTLGFIPKPWGELIVFRDNAYTSSRILYLERGRRTSFHYHLLRDEIFFVLDDRIRIRLWDRHIELNKNQSLRIPAGVPHSVIALESGCRVLEITEGFCDPQRDIVRIHDMYERPRSRFGDDDGLI